MAEALSNVEINSPVVPVISNVRAASVQDPTVIRSLLVEQVTGAVRWRESVAYMADNGVTEIWEIGAGKALSGMIRRIDKSVVTRNIGTSDDIKAALDA
jgi:[acyl-carrier-protein] S-malonyltransferase